ncbi:hypothetical protein PLAN_70109 [Planktothrix rubescens CCAP 1459/22]|uniref:Uncharacterized protein n=1 Tax=Planktothrix rubescens CCAP 1459/22 TaxID=329571 RepID=A0A6J7ZS60_PLARU|nr:hypothetical protein PLAN_70109 [Planktothrix rubescens NIVA-CYA 18]CAD5957509.1 hypothetical protein PCC7821_02941 [Planktothrix rubescens NIVA-CYA 18]
MSNPLSQDPSQNLLPSTSFSALNWNLQEPNPAVILQSDLLIGHINQNPNITALTPNPLIVYCWLKFKDQLQLLTLI